MNCTVLGSVAVLAAAEPAPEPRCPRRQWYLLYFVHGPEEPGPGPALRIAALEHFYEGAGVLTQEGFATEGFPFSIFTIVLP